ncbi:AfsA-related hotdog domain-containing protein [Streptomyces sp. NPDC093510]|uniref:AfsA-related hotdog domain-containing protein n=1 Tax=Streptomyces sp. NPDC093510 TaxID=3155199 RepID=UPI003433E6A3
MSGDGPSSAGTPAAGGGTLRLVHRARTWDQPGPSSEVADGGEAEFVLSGELPHGHPVFGDGPRRFHDLQAGAEMVREIGEFLGQSLFRIPADRTGIFYRFTLAAPDICAWRAEAGRAALLTTFLRVRPDKVIDGVPRALEFRTDLQIDDVPCGTGTANVVFLPPVVYRNHLAHGRTSAQAGPPEPVAPLSPVDPWEVGRTRPGNVLVHGPSRPAHGRLSVGVSVPAGWPLPATTAHGHVPAAVQLEALRQTALLCAGRTHRLAPDRCTLSSLEVHFRGYVEPGTHLRCAAVAGPCARDTTGHRQAPVTLTLAQAGRTVLEAVTTVVEDF